MDESPLLSTRFSLVRKLGQGGMGVVYEAVDLERGAHVALKTLPKFNPVALYRFKHEFRTLANLAHASLVPLYELISDGKTWFFTMELVDGVDFLTFVRRSALPAPSDDATQTGVSLECWADPERLRDALRQLAEGVAHLHDHGILHRDLKPSNVLIRPGGRVSILDFGLVKELDFGEGGDYTVAVPDEVEATVATWATLTGRHHIVGSVPYMAPEQAAGESLTEAADWYAVGVMLYEALSGVRPFVGDSGEVLTRKLTQDAPVLPTHIRAPDDLSELCRSLLRREPRDRPSDGEILRRLSPGLVQPVRDLPKTVALVGREEHLASMHEALAAVERGRTAVLHVCGASGCGKSVLVQRFLQEIERKEGLRWLVGRCYEQESVPFKALDSLVDALCQWLTQMNDSEVRQFLPRDVASLARVFPVLQHVRAVAEAMNARPEIPDPQEVRRRAFRAMGELLQRLGDRYVLVLHIDDLQWGDVDSVALLTSFLTSPDPPRLLLIASYRDEDRASNPCLTAFLDIERQTNALAWHTVTVAPLSLDQSKELAALLLPRGIPADLERVARESRGSPYFVHELVAYARDPQRGDTTPGDLDGMLANRVAQLSEPAQRLLQIVALAGKPVPLENAFTAASLADDAQPALGVLRAERLVRTTGAGETDVVETYHDRVRESVAARLEASVAREHHRRLARSLSASGSSDVEAIALHFHRAGDLEQAAGYYAQAGSRAATALAFDRAAELFKLALDLPWGSADRRRDLRTKRADALANGGRGVEAAHEYLAAAEGADPQMEHTLRRSAGYQFSISGHIDEGREQFRQVLAALGLRMPSTRRRALLSMLLHRVQALVRGVRFTARPEDAVSREELDRIDTTWSVACGITMIDPIRGADFQTRNLLEALHVGEPYRVARALAWDATHLSMLGVRFKGRATRLLDAASQLADQLHVPHAQGMVKLSRGVTSFFFGEFDVCRVSCEEAEAIFSERCTGVAWELDTCHAFQFWSLYFNGRFDALTSRLGRLLAQARERGARLAEADVTTFGGPFVWLARDDPNGAEEAVASAMRQWSHQDYQVQHYTQLTANAQIALYRGDGERALRLVNEEWSKVAGAMLLQVEIVRVYMLHLRGRAALSAARTSADRDSLLKLVADDARKLGRQRAAYAKPLGQMLDAALATKAGDRDRAAALLGTAADTLDALSWGGFGVSARRQQGVVMGGEPGAALVAEIDRQLAAQGVKDPARFAQVHAPGFNTL
jgi:hypothetical protein